MESGRIILKNTIEKTNVMRILAQKKAESIPYSYASSGAVDGMDVANALHKDPHTVFKTLVTVGKSSAHYVFVIPVNKQLDLKKAADAVDEKNICMVKAKELLPLTGYIHGGCSPVGMKHPFVTVLDQSAEKQTAVVFSGGKIGYQVEITLDELKKAIDFRLADIAF